MTGDETHALEWFIRSADRQGANVPPSCDYCNKPEQERHRHFKTKEEREAFIRSTKMDLGCIGEARIPYRFIDGYKMYRCPHLIKQDSDVINYVRAYAWYDHHGTLPYGDMMQVSEKLVQAFETIRSTYRTMDKERAERRRDEIKQHGRRS